MGKIFIVTCPHCKKSFPAEYEDLRHKGIKLLCPWCSTFFSEEQSVKIQE